MFPSVVPAGKREQKRQEKMQRESRAERRTWLVKVHNNSTRTLCFRYFKQKIRPEHTAEQTDFILHEKPGGLRKLAGVQARGFLYLLPSEERCFYFEYSP